MKITTIKYILCGLLISAALFDIITFYQHSNFHLLESNFLFQITGNAWSLVLVKFLIIGLMCFGLLYLTKKGTPTTQYFWIHIVMVLIIAQCLAGCMNMYAKEQVRAGYSESIGEEIAIGDIPEGVVEQVAMEKLPAIKSYFLIVFILIYLPLLLPLISFKIWEKCFYNHNIWWVDKNAMQRKKT